MSYRGYFILKYFVSICSLNIYHLRREYATLKKCFLDVLCTIWGELLELEGMKNIKRNWKTSWIFMSVIFKGELSCQYKSASFNLKLESTKHSCFLPQVLNMIHFRQKIAFASSLTLK